MVAAAASATPEVNRLQLQWQDIERDCAALAQQLRQHPSQPWQGIVCITRGGMIPAHLIARDLGIYWIDTLCISSYQGQQRGEARLLKGVAGDGENLLLIDDLVDSGHTALLARRLLPKAHFACLYAKPEGKAHSDFFVGEIAQDCWIDFPWDS